MSSADYMTPIRERAAENLPEILCFLKACGHPKENEVEDAVVEAARVYFQLSRFHSREQKRAMKKIAADARRLRGSLAPKNFTNIVRKELHEIVDAHLERHPANTFGHIFAKSSVGRLFVQLEQVIRACERLAPPAGNRKRQATPAKRILCEDCVIVFDCFREGEATSGQKGDFLSFVELVFEVATGAPPSRETSMSTPIKNMLMRYRTLLKKGKKGENLWRSL